MAIRSKTYLCWLLSMAAPLCGAAQRQNQLPVAPSAVKEQQQHPAPPATATAAPERTNPSQPAPSSAQGMAQQQAVAKPDHPSPATSSAAETSAKPDEPTPATTIRVPVNEVNLIFTATDKHGRYIKNLTQQDIKVLDDHKAVEQIRSFHSETDLPLRVGLLIDASNSIRERFQFEQESAIEFLNQIVRSRSDLAFVAGFDSTTEITQDFTGNTEQLAHGVRMLRPGGGTAMFDAIYKVCRDKLMKVSQGEAVRRAIILVSDGEDDQSRVSRDESIEMAQRAGVIIYAISTNVSGTPGPGDKLLKFIADQTGGRYFAPFKIEDVANAFSDIQEELRSQYMVAYKPPDFQADGRYRSVEILPATNKKARIRSRKGYFAPRL